MQSGLDKGFSFYKQDVANLTETARYGRLSDLDVMASIPENEIRSSGYLELIRIGWIIGLLKSRKA